MTQFRGFPKETPDGLSLPGRGPSIALCDDPECRAEVYRFAPDMVARHTNVAWNAVSTGEDNFHITCTHCSWCGNLTYTPGRAICAVHGTRCVAHQNSSCPIDGNGCIEINVDCPNQMWDRTLVGAACAKLMWIKRKKRPLDGEAWTRLQNAIETDWVRNARISPVRVLQLLGYGLKD